MKPDKIIKELRQYSWNHRKFGLSETADVLQAAAAYIGLNESRNDPDLLNDAIRLKDALQDLLPVAQGRAPLPGDQFAIAKAKEALNGSR